MKTFLTFFNHFISMLPQAYSMQELKTAVLMSFLHRCCVTQKRQ